MLVTMTIQQFRRRILQWFTTHKRDLPWRNTINPYRILVSEIMLQQTQVSRVIPKYAEFLRRFPSLASLARAQNRDLLAVWSGLGYWRRAQYLKQTATIITTHHNGRFPRTSQELQKLPGVGPYTAGAIACFAFGSTQPFIDTNIRRVLLYFFFHNKENVTDKELLPIANKAVWKKDPRAWHWALFDYGSIVLNDRSINQKSRHYTKQSSFTGSFRFFRTRALHYLLALPRQNAHRDELLDFLDDTLRTHECDYPPLDVLESLVRDGLVKRKGTRYSV